jgi:hypothetical protein
MFLMLSAPLVPSAEAGVQDVQLRLDTAIQYPNDRQVNIVVEAMAFENDKPSLQNVEITALIKWKNGTTMFEQSAKVQPGLRTSMVFPPIDEVGTYYVYAFGEAGGLRSTTESQTMRITYAPQLYRAGFTSQSTFLVSPNQGNLNLTIQEYLDDGLSITPGKTYKTNGSILEIGVPSGFLAVRYNIIDENGWMNYERSDSSGLTVHGPPYVWVYGDLERVEPFASLKSTASIFVGIVGGLLVLVGVANFYFKARDDSLKRRKKQGTDDMPGWAERRRQRKLREQSEQDYWNRQRNYSSPYQRRY